MGTGKLVKCKACGHVWTILEGSGMIRQPAPKPLRDKNGKIICPKCKSTKVEVDTNSYLLWD